MTFKDSLYTVTTYLIPRLILPDWAMSLSKKTREIALGFKEFKVSGHFFPSGAFIQKPTG
jgi:hypothetical protein